MREGKDAPRLADVRIWRLEAGVEAIYGPVLEPVPKTLYPDLLIGFLEQGVIKADYRGATHTLVPGTLILCQPGEAVAFRPVKGTPPVRICLRFSSSDFQSLAHDVLGGREAMPYLPNFIPPDPRLSSLLVRFRKTLDRPASQLEGSSLLHDLLNRIMHRHASPGPRWREVKPERVLVRRVREFLEENYARNVSLDQLARLVKLSPFHLNRVFRTEVGLPPHAYQTLVRIERSKPLLARGLTIDQVALRVGFYDQSHFTNHFRRLLGFTPGQYQEGLASRHNDGMNL